MFLATTNLNPHHRQILSSFYSSMSIFHSLETIINAIIKPENTHGINQFLDRFGRKLTLNYTKPSPKLTYSKWSIVFVELGINIGSEILKTRPCVIISPSIFNTGDTLLVCPITGLMNDTNTQPKKTHSHQYLVLYPDQENNLSKPSFLNLWQIRCVSKKRLWTKIGHLTTLHIQKLNKKLQKFLDI